MAESIQPGPRARVRTEPLEGDIDPAAVLEAMRARRCPAALESSQTHQPLGRFSLYACEPTTTLTVRDGRLLRNDDEWLADAPDRPDETFWDALERAIAPMAEAAAEAPYAPGWIGFVGYEIGRRVERLPGNARRDTALPDLHLAMYPALLVRDHAEGSWSLTWLDYDDPPSGTAEAIATMRAVWDDARNRPAASGGSADDTPAARTLGEHRPDVSREAYLRAVERCLDYIAAGDIFQVNLSHRIVLPDAPAPLELYHQLRRRNPSTYGAWLEFPSAGEPCAIVSASPELFLRVRGSEVITRPIKGTRPRTGDEIADRAARDDLVVSAKDNAELAMIVDLLRNDLGRVCTYGSVRVRDRAELETHPTVYHLVATVDGRLREGVGAAALLRATFPGGSITGAPKVRAMEIIDELEPTARGPYTGSIGIVGADGRAEWNITIRTVVYAGGQASLQVGGGIVADSTPEAEYNETLDKARALLEAVASAKPTACPER
jgi:para-aminobenzoate synthetase component I